MDDKYVYRARYGGILLSAALVHSSKPVAHTVVCDDQNKVYSYLAAPTHTPMLNNYGLDSPFITTYSVDSYIKPVCMHIFCKINCQPECYCIGYSSGESRFEVKLIE